jgi:hypothetical protein
VCGRILGLKEKGYRFSWENQGISVKSRTMKLTSVRLNIIGKIA